MRQVHPATRHPDWEFPAAEAQKLRDFLWRYGWVQSDVGSVWWEATVEQAKNGMLPSIMIRPDIGQIGYWPGQSDGAAQVHWLCDTADELIQQVVILKLEHGL